MGSCGVVGLERPDIDAPASRNLPDLVSAVQFTGHPALDQRQEGIDDARVEMDSALGFQVLDRLIRLPRVLVGALVHQGVVDIGNGGDPAADRNLVALQSRRITSPVEFLMVRFSDFGA